MSSVRKQFADEKGVKTQDIIAAVGYSDNRWTLVTVYGSRTVATYIGDHRLRTDVIRRDWSHLTELPSLLITSTPREDMGTKGVMTAL